MIANSDIVEVKVDMRRRAVATVKLCGEMAVEGYGNDHDLSNVDNLKMHDTIVTPSSLLRK